MLPRCRSIVVVPVAFTCALALAACGDKPQPKPPTTPGSPATKPTPEQGPMGGPTGGPADAGKAPEATNPSGTPQANGSTPATPPAVAPPAPDPNAPAWTLSTADSDPKKMQIGGIEAPKPATWTWQQPISEFRKLQYAIPTGPDSKDAGELWVSLFTGTDGGPLEQNINRWAAQFRDADGKAAVPKREEKEVDGMKVVLVELKGAYQAMGATSLREDSLHFGAIIRAPGRTLFIRAIGPSKAMETERANWDKLIAGIKKTS